MTRVYIPELNSILRITKDWTFDLYIEERNRNIFSIDKPEYANANRCPFPPQPYKRTLPAGTEFMVSRIYIRKGMEEFSSITMYITKTTDKQLTKFKPKKIKFFSGSIHHYGRFWVKLQDFNDAKMELVLDATDAFTVEKVPCTTKTLQQCGAQPKFWVKFEHPDPDLAFEGEVQTMKTKPTSDMYYRMYPFPSKAKKGKNFLGVEEIVRIPLYYVDSLIPDSWIEKHTNNPKFRPFGSDVPKHPHEDILNIPKSKKERDKMGIVDNDAPLENIDIAGGKLTIYKIVKKLK